jgi:hypothetical protein
VAAGGALTVGLVLTLYRSSVRGARLWQLVIVWLLSVSAPACVSFLLLMRSNSATAALWGTLGGWQWVFSGKLTSLPFYRKILGADDTLGHLWSMVEYAGALGMVVLAMLAGAWALRRNGRYRFTGAGLMAVLCLVLLVRCYRDIPWFELLRPLPILLTALAAIRGLQAFRLPQQDPRVSQAILGFTLTLFGLLLLAKMGLKVHLFHYGFALVMPGTMIAVVALVAWLPRWVERAGGAGVAFRATVLTALGLTAFFHLGTMSTVLADKTTWVGAGPDQLRSDRRARLLSDTLELLRRQVGPEQTLAVLPEGVMLNFLTRRVNPTPYSAFLPVELIMFGEGRIVQAFERSPPDFVALVHVDTSEYGYRFFGHDYGQQLQAWVEAHYRPVKLLGGMPLSDQGPGVLLLEREQAPLPRREGAGGGPSPFRRR